MGAADVVDLQVFIGLIELRRLQMGQLGAEGLLQVQQRGTRGRRQFRPQLFGLRAEAPGQRLAGALRFPVRIVGPGQCD